MRLIIRTPNRAPRAAQHLAAAVAVLALIGGGATAARAESPLSIPAAEVVLTPAAEPESDTVTAIWGTRFEPTDGFPIAAGATSVRVTLPAELSAHAGDDWSFALTPSTPPASPTEGPVVDADGSSFSVPIPATIDGSDGALLALSNTGSPTRISLYVFLYVSADETGPTAAVTLRRAESTDYAHALRYQASASAFPASPGSVVTLTSAPGTWTTGPDGDWADPAPVRASLVSADHLHTLGSLASTVSVDGSTVSLQIPSVAPAAEAYFPGAIRERAVQLSVSMMEKGVIGETVYGGAIQVSADLTLVPASKTWVDRVAGADRYTGAVEVSRRAYPDGAGTAFVVTGENYPDALSAGPAAVHHKAPLLLTRAGSLPAETEAELVRLGVRDVYIVGGTASVSDAVATRIATATGAAVHRVGGADRYAASRALVQDTFGATGAVVAYIATGRAFPDALAAGGAAGHVDAPVVLVDGSSAHLDEATARQLEALKVSQIKIAGGPAAVSAGIEADLAAIAPTVRLAGDDRVLSAAAINIDAYQRGTRAFVVTGSAFPDGLTGSAWAGALGVPLYVSRPDCLPGAVADGLARQQIASLTLLGGPAALAPAVEDFRLCGVQ